MAKALECLRHRSLQFDWCNNIPSHWNHFSRLPSVRDVIHVQLGLGTRLTIDRYISVLNALLDRVLTQPENDQASSSKTPFSRNEMMLDSAG